METLRVLVVDDEPGMRLGVARALVNFKFALPDVNGDVAFKVETAESGEGLVDLASVLAAPNGGQFFLNRLFHLHLRT